LHAIDHRLQLRQSLKLHAQFFPVCAHSLIQIAQQPLEPLDILLRTCVAAD